MNLIFYIIQKIFNYKYAHLYEFQNKKIVRKQIHYIRTLQYECNPKIILNDLKISNGNFLFIKPNH